MLERFIDLFLDKYVIRYRNDALIAYYAGQKMIQYKNNSISLSESILSIPSEYVSKDLDINYFISKAKASLLPLDLFLYKVNSITPQYARKITDQRTAYNNHLELINYFNSLKSIDENGLFFNHEDIDNIIKVLEDTFKTIKFDTTYDKDECIKLSSMKLRLDTSNYNKDNILVDTRKKYIMLNYNLTNLTVNKSPYKRMTVNTTNKIEDEVFSSNNINTLVEAVKDSIDFYNNMKPGKQKEKMFQDFLMHQDTIDVLVSLINSKSKKRYNLVPLEEEFIIKVKDYNNPDKSKDGRIDNIYFNSNDNHILFMEVKMNSTVILEKDTGIASHLKDMCMWIKNKDKMTLEINELKSGIIERNKYHKNKITCVNDNILDYLIICGYESEEEKEEILKKIKMEENLISDLIDELKDSINTEIYLVNVNNTNNNFSINPNKFERLFYDTTISN